MPIRHSSPFLSIFLFLIPMLATAQAPPPRHRAVRGPAPLPTSATLIDKALAGGKLDAETALTYQVYSAFGDCRLPAEFRGDDSTVESSMILAELAANFDTLSPAGRANLSPFLLEPYAPGGWVEKWEARCNANKWIASNAEKPDTLVILGGRVGVTYRTDVEGEDAIATQIASEIEKTIYPKLTALMGREPMPYSGGLRRWNLTLVTIEHSVERDVQGGTGFLQPDSMKTVCKVGAAFSEIDPRAGRLQQRIHRPPPCEAAR